MEYYIPLRTEGELKTIYFFTNKKIFVFKKMEALKYWKV
jgi:hypothetical protein